MPMTDPVRRREAQAKWERARQRALKKLARVYPDKYRELLDIEREVEGIRPLGYNGRQKPVGEEQDDQAAPGSLEKDSA